MDKFLVKRNGQLMGTVDANDGRDVATIAVRNWGPGTYNIEMMRDHDDTRGVYHPEDDQPRGR